jgi:hypothetical protein
MIAVIRERERSKRKTGRTPALTIEEQVLCTLEFFLILKRTFLILKRTFLPLNQHLTGLRRFLPLNQHLTGLRRFLPLNQHLTGFLIPKQHLSGLDRLRR